MQFKVQILTNKPGEYQPRARNSARGRVWLNIGKPTRRLAKAETILNRVRVDQPDAVVRIREVQA
ncbi:hypothetical protein ACVI1K_001149 [Bradyrhizobium sp. USDA 4508]